MSNSFWTGFLWGLGGLFGMAVFAVGMLVVLFSISRIIDNHEKQGNDDEFDL